MPLVASVFLDLFGFKDEDAVLAGSVGLPYPTLYGDGMLPQSYYRFGSVLASGSLVRSASVA